MKNTQNTTAQPVGCDALFAFADLFEMAPSEYTEDWCIPHWLINGSWHRRNGKTSRYDYAASPITSCRCERCNMQLDRENNEGGQTYHDRVKDWWRDHDEANALLSHEEGAK